ncbi:helix-turn-helix domain-containing protein [Microvirga sp. 2TAF3]|uniref:helix-turn-helix domain-containing protein n=1 Tax=Microvirga sp. 2TAF3 TaxID=3233014 RepID=UPI003F9A4F10
MRLARNQAGLSQTTVANALGITFQQLQKYEKGTNRISASMLVRAAKALGIAPTALLVDAAFDDAAPMPLLNKTTIQIVVAFQSLPPDMRHVVVELVEAIARRSATVS